MMFLVARAYWVYKSIAVAAAATAVELLCYSVGYLPAQHHSSDVTQPAVVLYSFAPLMLNLGPALHSPCSLFKDP